MSRRLANAVCLITLLGMFLVPTRAHAQEWYDQYERGVQALRKKQPLIAASLFERAIRKQPTPGENMLTYGTNRLPRYYPYLRLAEALAMAGDFDRARNALERSEASGKEPSGERVMVMKAINAASIASPVASPPSVAPAPSPLPSPLASREPTSITEASPVQTTTPPASSLTSGRTVAPDPSPLALVPSPRAAEGLPAPRVRTPELTASPSPTAAAGGASSVLELNTSPGAADVYLDGEFIGRSDGSGRLTKRGVGYGRHELRVSGVDGFLEQRDQIEVSSESTRRVAILDKEAGVRDSSPLGPWIGLFLGALALVVVVSLFGRIAKVHRRSRRSASAQTQLAPTELAPRGVSSTGGGKTKLDTPAHSVDLATVALPASLTSTDGSTFGEYQLLEQIGKGGMAAVFRARRRGEEVALKRPLAAFLGAPEFVERFVREAEIGRTLNHPNIIRIFDKGRVGDVPYFTMEIVDGETLHALARREGALSPSRACDVVKQVAEALDYSHLKGVIHRDLKPSNIMILKSGTVKVMDYGIARSARMEALTATGAFLGTPEYVAPETAEGGRTDAQSDLYSLGVVFYEILTGVRPFIGDTPFATLKKICTEAPTPPSAVRNCPDELEAVVLKLLKKNPAERHASAEELLNDLNDYLNRVG